MKYELKYYKYKSKYSQLSGGKSCESPTNQSCNDQCSADEQPCYEDPIDMECYSEKHMKCLSDNTLYSKNIIEKWPNGSPFTRREWTQEDRNKMEHLEPYITQSQEGDEPDDYFDNDLNDQEDELSIDDDHWDYDLSNHNNLVDYANDLGALFYYNIQQQLGEYIFLIGGGNFILSNYRYTDLQDDMEGTHRFVGEFVDGPMNYQTNNLDQAIEYFKNFPSKDEYGVSISICFISEGEINIREAYCLLSYKYFECTDGLPTTSHWYIQDIKNNLSLNAHPLPTDRYKVLIPEFCLTIQETNV